MLLTRPVDRRGRFFAVMAYSAIAIFVSGSSTHQQTQTAILDLTASVPPNEQGYYHGMPGMSGGGGAWRPGPGDTVRYRLPLTVEIVGVSTNKDGNFVFELSLRNTDSTPFDFPSSSKLTTIERPGNESRRVFRFQLQALGGGKPGMVALGFATTAGSTSVPGSFIRLDRGKSIKILLLGSLDLIKRSFSRESPKLAIKAICNEERLADGRYFLTGISAELPSSNAIIFSSHDGQITPVQP